MWRKKIAIISAVVIIFGIGSFLLPNSCFSANEVFTQTDWTGGTSATNATHPTNKSGWNTYTSKDANINTSQAGKVILSPTSTAVTETTDTDFNAGVYNHTEVAGIGIPAGVKLTSTTQDPFNTNLNTWQMPKQLPGGVGSGGALCYPGTGDFIYAIKGGYSQEFLKYSISLKRWYHLANLPKTVGPGADLVHYNGYVYCMQGNGWQGFWRYSIAAGTWEIMASTPEKADYGGKLLYAFWNGNPTIFATKGLTTTTFWAYNISTNQWASGPALPTAAVRGTALTWDGSNYIYYKKGEYTWGFYKLNLTTNTWTGLADAPLDTGYGSCLLYPGSGDGIYVSRGYNTKTGWSYSISGNTWTEVAHTPGDMTHGASIIYNPNTLTYFAWGGGYGDNWYPELWEYNPTTIKWIPVSYTLDNFYNGGSLCYDGTEYLYGMGGEYGYTGVRARKFYRYSTTNNIWLQLADTPGDVGIGGSVVYAGGYVYALAGNSAGFWRYEVGTNTWVSRTAVPLAVGAGASLVYPGLGDYIYAVRGGGTTGFYQYTISTDTWVSLASTPQNINAGGDSAYLSTAGGYIFCLAGNGAYFFRYSVADNTWTTLTNCPQNVYSGGNIAYTGGGGDYIYVSVGNERAYFLRYSITGNSWDYLEPMPFYHRIYTGSVLVYGGGVYIYATRGYGGRDFSRYNITAGKWDTPAAVVSTAYKGSTLVKAGNYLYCLQGHYTKRFLKYSLINEKWEYLASLPISAGDGASLSYTGGDYIYALAGGYQKNFYRYTISTDTWITLNQFPNFVSQGGSLVWNGADNFYALRGESQDFYRYTISTDSWDVRAFTPAVVDYGSALLVHTGGDYIYCLRGTGTDFWRYTISTNMWTTMASTSDTVEEGSSIVYPGTGDYIYAMQGSFASGRTTGFWRYSIAQNKWSKLAATPIGINYGSAIVSSGNFIYVMPGDIYGVRDIFCYSISDNIWNAASDGKNFGWGGGITTDNTYIYGLQGDDSPWFYRYTPSTNTWDTLSSIPGYARGGAAICYVKGSDYIYAMRGNASTDFYRYSISNNSWQALSSLLAVPSSGSSLCYPGTGDFVYAIRGAGTADAWKYSITNNTWQVIASAPSLIENGGYLTSDGADYIYTMRGYSGTELYRYSISGNSWASLAATPALLRDGGSLYYPGFGDYLYALRGYAWTADINSTDFWRYSISGNTWEQLNNIPIRVGFNSGMLYMGGDYLYVLTGSNNYLIKYKLFTSGTFISTAKNAGTNGGFGTITWTDNTDNKNSFIKIKARTANDSTMSAAMSWSNVPLVTKGVDLSTLSSVSDGNSYLQYQGTFLTSDITKIPQLDDLTFNYDYYPQKQELISSAYNTTTGGNRLMKLSWNKTLPQGSDLRFQLRTAQDSAGSPGTWGSWIGPTGTTFITNDFSLAPDYSTSSLIKLQGGLAALKKELEDFQYKQTITVDNSTGSAQINAIVGIDLPVSNNLFWTHVQSSGNDIRFYDGTQKLAYKLFSFDYTKKTAVVNVKIPTLAAGETKTIYLLYGSANALSEEDTTLSDAPRNGLKVWWKFDETSGTTAADSSGNLAAATFVSSPTWVTGKTNNALRFNGMDDFVLTSSAGINITGTLTLGMWIKPELIREQGICGRYDNGAYWTYRLYMDSNGKIVFQRGNYSATWQTTLTSNAVIKGNEWTYISAVYDGANMKLYINNTLDNSASETRSGASNAYPFVVGTNTYAGTVRVYYINNTFQGLIDNVCVFNRAVTDAERNALYNGNSGISTVVGASVSLEENTSGPALGASWPYRRKITVVNPSADNLTSHQVGVDFSGANLNSTRKPVSNWRFNEGSGQSAADGSGTNTATLGSTAGVDTNDPTWITSGKFGNALQFDGVDDYVDAGNSSTIHNLVSFSIEAWVKFMGPGSAGENPILYDRGGGCGDRGYWLLVKNDRTIQFAINNQCSNGLTTTAAVKNNDWSHVVAKFDGTKLYVYIDGVEQSQNSLDSALVPGTSNLRIGGGYYGNLNGAICEVRIYNRALSTQEIQGHYNSGNNMGLDLADLRFVWVNPADSLEQVIPHWFETDNKAWVKIPSISAYAAQTVYMYYGNPNAAPTGSFDNVFTKDYGTDPFLAGLWHFDDNAGTNAIDSSGRSNNGTLTNGPVWQASDGGQWGSRGDVKFSTGSALYFDGVNDYVDVGSSDTLNFSASKDFAITAWINVDNSATSWGAFYSTSTEWPAGGALHLWYNGTNLEMLYNYGGGSAYDTLNSNSITITKGVWHQVVVVVSKNVGYFYYDGASVGTDSGFLSTMNKTNGSKHIGYSLSSSRYFKGLIDEVRVYSRALSASEIYQQYIRSKYASPALAATLSLYTETANAYSSTNYTTVNSVVQPIFGAFYNNDLAEFQETATKPAGSEIKYQVSPNGYRWYWWNGSAWAAVAGGYSEANTAAIINSNLATFMTQVASSGEFFYRAYLHSDTGTATPSLDQVKIATASSTSYYIDYTGTTAINLLHNDAFNDQWFQYKAILYSSGKDTPILDDVTLEYINALITITSPNTAVTWQTGSAQNITWTAVGLPAGDTVKISYSTDAGSNWNLITASVTATNGTYPWTVPEAQTAQARIRVVSNTLPAVSDISDVNFTIGGIKITSPNSGETWEVGTAHNITWTTVGTVSNLLTIEYSKDNFATATLIADQRNNNGVYSWVVPNDVSNNIKIRIRDIVSPFAADTSDLNLRVQPVPQITVNVPNGGEAWQVGTQHQITWTANSAVSNNLKFEYSKDDFVSDIHEIKSMQVVLPGWNYSIPVTINNSTNTNNLTDYQVKISIDSTLSSFWNHVKSDGSDIRFYDYNPSAVLPYYLGTFDYANKNAVIYVKLPLIPASSSKIINLCYGNPSAVSLSSFDNVFPTGYSETGLVGLWHLSEGRGTTTVDLSGNNNNGTLIGNISWSNSGQIGNSLNLDGIDDYVSLGSPTSLRINNTLTIAAWVKTGDSSKIEAWIIAQDGSSVQRNYELYLASGQLALLYGNGTVNKSIGSTLNIADNNWHFVAVSINGLNVTFYKDNVSVNKTLDFNIGSTSGGLYKIGGLSPNYPGTVFVGNIDEVRVYNRALSDDEIRAQYQRKKTASPEPTVSFGTEKGNVSATPVLPYYKVITINNSGVALTDYQFKIALDSSDTSFWSHVKSDGGDIRLYDESTELVYWLESFNYAGKSASIWVKLPSVAASSTKKLYLYYGNSSLTTLSNYDNVFTKDYGDTGLVGLWHMDAGSGNTVVDTSGNGNNGTLNGRAGLTFDGSDDYVEMGSPANLEPTNVTVEAWVKLSSLSTNQIFVGQDAPVSASGKGYELAFNQSSQTWQFSIRGTDWKGTSSTFNVDTTNWHYLVGTYDGISLNLYVDGVLKSTVPTTMAIQYREFTFRVGSGSSYGGSQYANGRISGVRVYNRAISSTEVTERYAGIYSNNTGLVGNWQMNDGGISQTVADSSGNLNNGTRGATSAVEGTDPLWFTEPPAWQAQDGGQWGSRTDVKFGMGSALSFDGLDDYVDLGNPAVTKVDHLTVAAWVKANDITSGVTQAFVDENTPLTAGWGYKIGMYQNSYLFRIRDNASGMYVSIGSPVVDTQWHYVVGTYDRTKAVFYVDGVQKASVNETRPIAYSNTGLKIGKSASSTEYFNGYIDEVSIYNRALSVAEIQAQYQRSKYSSTVPTYSIGTEQSNTVSAANFLYNKLVTIDNSGNVSALTDYQVKVTLNNTQDFFWSHVKSDGADVRFYDGATELPYWIETFNYAAKTAVIWVKVPSIPASGVKTIKIYYGNPIALTTANFDNVFTKDYGESGLIGLWHMDEGAGINAADVSGNNNTGILTNGPLWEAQDGGRWGDRTDVKFSTGSAVLFDGTNDYMNLAAYKSDPEFNTSVGAVAMWVKSQGASAFVPLFHFIKSGVSEFILIREYGTYIHAWGTVSGGAGAFSVYTPTGSISRDQWYYFVIVQTGSGIEIYINGVKQTLTGTNGTLWFGQLWPPNAGFNLGHTGSWAYYFNGNMDDVRMYNRVLSADEIKAYYQRRKYASPEPIASVEGDVTSTGSVYLWNIPDDVSSTVKVRIIDNNRPTCNDRSDSNFSITQPVITVTSPNGAEIWVNGDTRNITWNTSGQVSASLKLEYSKDNFVSNVNFIASLLAVGGWPYYKNIGIDNSGNPGALTNYQIKILIDNTDASFWSHVKSDGSDIRFYDITTELPYWIESFDSVGKSAVIWVKVPSIPASSTKLLHMIYGNTGALASSNGDNTFEFFDDFTGSSLDTNKWTSYIGSGAAVTVSGGLLNLFRPGTGDAQAGVWSKNTFTNIAMRTKVYPYNTGTSNIGYRWALMSNTSLLGNDLYIDIPGLGWVIDGSGNYYYQRYVTSRITTVVNIIQSGWRTYESRWSSGSEIKESYSDTAIENTFTTDIPNQGLYVNFAVGDRYGNPMRDCNFDIDWVLLRKYSAVEPVISLGPEGNVSVPNSYPWVVPNDASSTVKVRVSDNARPAVTDSSDNNFQILGHARITVTSPNGGESLIMGNTHNITWTSDGAGVSNNLKIESSTNNGSTWSLVADQRVNNGTYTWTVPNVETTQGLIRISDNMDVLVTDTSNAAFAITIPTITITSPNGGETWYATGSYNITWSSVGSVSNNLKLEYTLDGTNWTQIATALANSGTYAWTAPDSASLTCKVRITDNTRLVVTDASNANFSIAVPAITVTSPNGAEEWVVGTAHNITWASVGTNNSIKNNLSLQYSKDNFATNTSISIGQANNGSYAWTIPDDVSAAVKVKIFDASRPATVDTSDANFSITQPYVRVTAPNGGESWVIGTAHDITWTSLGAISNNLKLEYSKDNFVTVVIISTAEINDGIYAWTVPDDVSSTAKVRITDANRPAATDMSDGSFAIANSILTVTRPNGGELFTVGDTENITWTSTGTVSNNLKLEYSKDNFATAGIAITTGLSNTGIYPWTVPSDISAAVRVRITDNTRPAVWGKSNAGFTILPIPQLTVVNPNGGETWRVGSIYTISWSDNGGVVSNNLTLQYSVDGGAVWINISTGEANDGSYSWTIPDNVSVSSKVRVYDASRPSNSDVSDLAFSIALPLITITSPNGGETYAVGDSPVITWTTDGAVSNNLTLEYTTDGTIFNLIKSVQANTGSYAWTVPDFVSPSVKIRITDGNRPAVFDLSNANFTVLQYPTVTVTAPNGNEVYTIGDAMPVTWTYKGMNITPLTITYSADNFVTSSVITTGVVHSLGGYNWTIPNNALAANTLKVKVYDPVRMVITDTSDANFRIKGGFTITAPVANARFIAKKAETISWTTRGTVANVKLEYSVDNGSTWNTIVSSVANTGTYSWSVADNRTANYTAKVRVSDPTDATIVSTSGAFKIDYYTISWRVMDYDNSASLQLLSVKDSFWTDQTNTINSPVDHDYPYGAYTTFWTKEGYIDRSTDWTADNDKIITVYLENQITASVEWHVLISNAYNVDTDTLKVSTWLERRGKLVGSTASDLADLSSATIEVYDGTSLLKTITETTHDNQGVFWLNWSNTALESGKTYFVKASITFRSTAYTSGASVDVTAAKKMLDEKQQLQTIQTQVDTTRAAVDSGTAKIESKLDDTKASIETKVTDVKTETAKILTSTETTLPQKMDDVKAETEVIRKSEILNRDNTIRSGQSLTVRYRTYSGLSPSVDVYSADNVLRVNKGVMKEINSTGIYEYAVTFTSAWGRGDFTIVCSESTKGTMDALIITVLKTDVEEISGQVSAVLGTTSGLKDVKALAEDLNSQFSIIETSLSRVGKDLAKEVKDAVGSVSSLEAIYSQLGNVAKEIKQMSGEAGINLQKLYEISSDKKHDIDYLKNKTQQLKAAMALNQKTVDNIANKPVTQTWYEYK